MPGTAQALVSTLTVTPDTPTIGATVTDCDLRAVDEQLAAQIRQALLDHLVLYFPNQPLTDEEHIAFASHFGEPHCSEHGPTDPVHPEVLMLDETGNGQPGSRSSGIWHRDHTFVEHPPLGSILRSVQLPPSGGGDTCFASMYRAYETLSAPMQSLLEGLTAEHERPDLPLSNAKRNALATSHDDEVPTTWVHPVVEAHPETGRKLFNVNKLFTKRVVELSEPESAALLSFLYEHINTPEFHCRFKWDLDAVVFWDNRAVQHYANQDYFGQRVMRRVTITDSERR